MTLAGRGVIPLPMALSLVVGANVGTCSSALASAVGGSRETLRVALTYLMYKAAGAVVCMAALGPLATLIARMSHNHGEALAEAEDVAAALGAAASGATDAPVLSSQLSALRRAVVPLVVANCHAVFNLAVGILFLPLSGTVSAVMLWVVPDAERTPVVVSQGTHGGLRFRSSVGGASVTSVTPAGGNSGNGSKTLGVLGDSGKSSPVPTDSDEPLSATGDATSRRRRAVTPDGGSGEGEEAGGGAGGGRGRGAAAGRRSSSRGRGRGGTVHD